MARESRRATIKMRVDCRWLIVARRQRQSGAQDERQSSRDISDNRKQLARRTNRERSCPRYRPPPSTLIAAAVSPRLTRHIPSPDDLKNDEQQDQTQHTTNPHMRREALPCQSPNATEADPLGFHRVQVTLNGPSFTPVLTKGRRAVRVTGSRSGNPGTLGGPARAATLTPASRPGLNCHRSRTIEGADQCYAFR